VTKANDLLREIRRHNSSGLTKDMQGRIDAVLSQQVEPIEPVSGRQPMNNAVTLPRELAEMIERTWRAKLGSGQDNVIHGLIRLRLILAQQAEPVEPTPAKYSDLVSDGGMDPRNEPALAQDERELSAEEILMIFERNGFHIESGASYSAKGQIAQLLNAAGELLRLNDNRPAQTEQQPVKLQHMACAEDGVLRWLTGRKIGNCELYAMPDFGKAPTLYTAPIAQTALPVDRLVEGLDEISALTRYLRQGGCDATDLPGLEEGLTHATDMADELLSLIAGSVFTQTAPQDDCDWCAGAGHDYYGEKCQHCRTAPQPEQSGRYTCIGKGGEYELIGRATTAGVLKATGRFADEVIVYRDTQSSALYCREPGDFRLRMASAALSATPSPKQESSHD